MSNSAFRRVAIPAVALTTVLAVGVTITANTFSTSLDTYVGKGERIVQTTAGVENWDSEYYDQQFADTSATDGSVANGAKVSKQITDEGLVLLKNDGVLPLASGSAVTPFGYRYLSPVYSGSGSGNVDTTGDYVVTSEEGLAKYFEVNDTVVETMRAATPREISSDTIKDAPASEDTKGFEGANTSIIEYDPSIYGAAESAKGTTGVVYLGRLGGEGGNLQSSAYADGTEHALQLSEYELDTVRLAKEKTDAVIAVINASNVMELGPLLEGELAVDAIVWIGGAGSTGFASLADIMVGEVNPSGRTVDIWDADLLANPTSTNFAPDRTYTNTADTQIASNYDGLYYVEYEEGMYYGYRYYETAAELGAIDYETAVDFPFGFGLSYATFEQKVASFDASGDDVVVTVDVTNSSDIDGKEVVQLYYGAPYTEFDSEHAIEKPTKNLVAFDKVEVAAGATEQVSLTFPKEDMASYSNVRENPDGTVGAYVLAQGDYEITIGRDSHEAWATETVQIAETEWFDSTNVRQSEIDMQSALAADGSSLGYPAAAAADTSADYIASSNQFADSSAYMIEQTTMLSRADWEGTQPTSPEEKELSAERLDKASQFDVENDAILGTDDSLISTDTAPTSGAANGLVLSDLRGADYNDPAWDELLDQIDYSSEDLQTLLFVAAFQTGELESIGKPASQDHDGPSGFNLTGAEGGPESTAYASGVVLGSTWNTDLMFAFGESVGQEALTIGYSGWYGPGMNIHRSPFGGRNYEYYSEDPVLTGALAAEVISGSGQAGLVTYMKHFGLNEYEGPATAVALWASEQVIREVYLKAFEIALRDGRMTIEYISDNEGTVSTRTMRAGTALMASASLMDGEWAAANHNLLTNVVRGEWGFQGVISTDMFLQNSPNIADKVLRAGSDLKLWFVPGTVADTESATAQESIRRAIHNIGYAYTNSNLMQGAAPGVTVSYAMAPWQYVIIGFDVLMFGLAAFLIVAMVLRARDEKRNPNRYKQRSKKVAAAE